MAYSNYTRKRVMTGYHASYSRFDSPTIDGNYVCYYCGLPSDTVDHHPPISTVAANPDAYPEHKRVLVSACRECNSLLGAKVDVTLEVRKKRLKQELRRRYESAMKTPMWYEEELEELGEKLRTYVQAGISEKNLIFRRLRW